MFSADVAMEAGPLATAMKKQVIGPVVTQFPDNAAEALLRASDIPAPQTDKQAATSQYASKWQASDAAEISQVIDKGVLTPVNKSDIPANASVVPCKMIRTAKGKSDGLLAKFKSRLVAKGFRQKYGRDYDATYASVAMISTIKMLLAVAAHFNMVTFQFDVEGAFLLPDLLHKIYISWKGGYYLCHKCLYGLKQSPLRWSEELGAELRSLGMTKSIWDQSLYTRRTKEGWMLLATHVDDCVGACTTTNQRDELLEYFRFPFSATENLNWCLKIQVDRTFSNGQLLLGLSQPQAIEDLARTYSVVDSNKKTVPMASGLQLSKKQCPIPGSDEHKIMSNVPFASLLGSLLYIGNTTRGDILQAVNRLGRFTANPGKVHWQALKRVLVYLYHTCHRRLVFGANSKSYDLKKQCSPISIYCDADHGGDPDTAKSTSGLVVLVFGDAIHVRSKKQGKVSSSTGQAELYALDTDTRQHDVYRQLFFEMTNFLQKRILAFTDSQVIIAQVDKGDLSTKTKHLRLAFQAVLERVTDNDILLQHVSGVDNPADLFTKPLPKSEFEKHVSTILNDDKFSELEWVSCFYDRS